MNRPTRLPKYDYFMKRFIECKEAGLTKKANYYADRINQLRTSAPKTVSTNVDKFAKIGAKLNGLPEGQRRIECSKFIQYTINKGGTVNQGVAFLTKCGVDSTIVCHSLFEMA